MDYRFFRPHWSQSAVHPRYQMNDGGISGHSDQPFAQDHKPQARVTSKVIQIPVRFVDSEPSKPDSALKIQKVFRGFLVRSRVKKILQLKREALKIEERMSRSDVVELIQKDPRERLRINEMLMALLFKLDSIEGVDEGVRDCRKAVIKKVISLQERLDSVAEHIQPESPTTSKEESIEVNDSALSNSPDESDQNNPGNQIQNSECNISIKEPELEISYAEEKCFNNEVDKICEQHVEICQSETKSNEESHDTSRDEFENANHSTKEAESVEDINLEKETDEISNMTNAVMKENNQIMVMDSTKIMEESDDGEKENGMNNNNEQVMLKKLMEDNQTMMNMMTQLFERNEMQTQMLNTLRNKVDLLEKAFVCDRMRRKKKRHNS